jgi:hypothetical protein
VVADPFVQWQQRWQRRGELLTIGAFTSFLAALAGDHWWPVGICAVAAIAGLYVILALEIDWPLPGRTQAREQRSEAQAEFRLRADEELLGAMMALNFELSTFLRVRSQGAEGYREYVEDNPDVRDPERSYHGPQEYAAETVRMFDQFRPRLLHITYPSASKNQVSAITPEVYKRLLYVRDVDAMWEVVTILAGAIDELTDRSKEVAT